MSDTTNAAAALIRMYAAQHREMSESYFDLGETEAGNRATQVADNMEVAAHLLREAADPPYDAKAAAANALAYAAWRYLTRRDEANLEGLTRALEAYDEVEEDINE